MKFIEEAEYANMKEERLGQTSYYLKHPATMFIEEAKGKEGQLGYGLWQIDSLGRYTNPSGFIEVEHGRPIGWEADCDRIIEKAGSNLLNGRITWKICKSETGNYYSAIAKQGKLFLEANSRTRSGLDSMIAVISTLKSR